MGVERGVVHKHLAIECLSVSTLGDSNDDGRFEEYNALSST